MVVPSTSQWGLGKRVSFPLWENVCAPAKASWEQLSKLLEKVPGEVWQIGPIWSDMKAIAVSLNFSKDASAGTQTLSHKEKIHPIFQALITNPKRILRITISEIIFQNYLCQGQSFLLVQSLTLTKWFTLLVYCFLKFVFVCLFK